MSLQVWLPLTKDLRQQGLSTTTYTQNSGTAISSGGKLGSCLTATSNATVIVNLSTLATMLANGKTYSLACWVKITNNVTNGWVIKLGTNSCGLWWAASIARWVWNENDNGKRCANPTISGDANWHHLVTTVDKTVSGMITAKHYVDGVPAESYEMQTWDCSNHSQPAGTTITINPYVAQLNDIRLYDHCLSPMEVKELAKGLILHYPLDRQGWGQENLVLNSGYFTSVSGWTNNQNTTVSLDNNELKVVLNQTNSTPGIKTVNTINFSAGTYTASILVKITNRSGTNKIYFPFYLYNGSATVYSGQPTVLKQYGDYLYEEATFTVSETINNTTLYILQSGPENGETWYIKWVKIEKGSIATPWCPNSSDTLATTMGLNSTTEYDCSGFCNNGTRMGTFTWKSDTPKYAVDTEFAGDKTIYIQMPTITLDWSKVSFVAWGKWDAFNNWSRIFDIGNASSGADWDICLANHSTNANPGLGGRTGGGASWPDTRVTEVTLTAGQWYHFVETIDGTTCKLYVNGELKKTITLTNSPTITTMNRNYLGLSNWSGNGAFKGGISDFRIYATALSADDVKSLYQNCATIDPDGTIRGQIRS